MSFFGRREKLPPIEPETIEEELLLDILDQQRRQTRYLRDINLVAQGVGCLILLGLVIGCVLMLLGGTTLSSLF